MDQEQQFMVDTKGAGGQGQLEVAVVSLYLCLMFFQVNTVKITIKEINKQMNMPLNAPKKDLN